TAKPEREPVAFAINLVGAPPDVEELVNNIRVVAEQFLYHWKTFPIILPTPLSTRAPISESEERSVGRRVRALHLRDLFVTPPFDELDAVASDGKGEPRFLNKTQLQAIKERGEFEVPSLNFPDQKHKWRLSPLLQGGAARARETLDSDLALAARLLVITARERIWGSFFSIKEALKAMGRGLLKLLDLIFGVPSLQAHNLEAKIREERCRYLVAELICRSEFEGTLERLCSFIRRQLRRAATEKFEVERESSHAPVSVPYLYLTPNGQEVDLRLFSRDIMKRAVPVLIGILERETRGWFLHFRERLISELRAQKKSDVDIEREVNEAVMLEYLQRVYSCILAHPELQALGDGIPQLLVQQAQSVVLMHRAVESVQRQLMLSKTNLERNLKDEHPILSRVRPWLIARLANCEQQFTTEKAWSAHEEALRMCQEQRGLEQTTYFLNRDLTFMKEREPVLLKELRKVKNPTRSFSWPTRIWFSRNWIVRRAFQGHSEVIPTVLSQQATSIVTPRSDPSQPVFLVEKEVVKTSTTRWPFWRWYNWLQRTWSWTCNAIFLLGAILPWCSPIGMRALFFLNPFMPDLELSQINGTLFPRKSSLTQTLCSRLVELWIHISKSRTKFETQPDTGFIGKGLTRHTNRIWNYVIKGFGGTLCLLFLFPITCLCITLVSLFGAALAFIWVPCVTLILHLFMILIYDFDSPDINRNRFFVLVEALLLNIFLQGVVQPMIALTVAGVLCPVAAILVLIYAVFRYGFRLLWDHIAFHLIIRKRGRIPACDSFVVKRVSGPGLANDYYFQIKPEQALAAFEAKMELDELLAYQQFTEMMILQPQKDFSQFVEACFGPFSAQLAKFGPYKGLEKEAQDLISSLQEKLEKRRRDLQTGLSVAVKNKIKLNANELKIAIQQGALMLERFYPNHVLARLSISEEEFWDTKGLSPGDWAGLAGLMYTDIFSLDFLTPLNETDAAFKLDAHTQVDLHRYSEMVNSTELGFGGPDLLGAVYSPRGNIQIHSPYLEISAFNPRSRITLTTRKLEKRNEANSHMSVSRSAQRCRAACPIFSDKTGKTQWTQWKTRNSPRKTYMAEKLLIPLPVPHPVVIAITIHNRDSEQPIPIDSDICREIMRAVEDSHLDLHVNMASRYRGGAGGQGMDSSFDSIDSQTSAGTGDSLGDGIDGIGGEEEGGQEPQTLPCGGEDNGVKIGGLNTQPVAGYHWTLSNWGAATGRRRNNSTTVRVDLASPEDISLDTDSSRAVFNAYGTNV
ncbi:uncharacterized protein LOC113374909, partial [Ctenocephalides felis]|uniref:uncharacterized protein LOC113374909 n=1 Tax=Ctenocephalides felis TaxID=7515 RepID=UPI000E6E2017